MTQHVLIEATSLEEHTRRIEAMESRIERSIRTRRETAPTSSRPPRRPWRMAPASRWSRAAMAWRQTCCIVGGA